MLQAGQTLLATVRIQLHLGQEWRRPSQPAYTADYATYLQILTWFFDSRPRRVYSVCTEWRWLERNLGRTLGGPSTAADQIVGEKLPRCIAWCFSRRAGPSRLMYTRRQIRPHNLPVPASHRNGEVVRSMWSSVFGLEQARSPRDNRGVVYIPTISWDCQRRPSSSCRLVSSQADNLFYLDPHLTRATIPL